jgi:hypothetical protein
VSLVEQELLTFPVHPSSPSVFSGVHVTFKFYQVFSGDYIKVRIYQVFSGVHQKFKFYQALNLNIT